MLATEGKESGCVAQYVEDSAVAHLEHYVMEAPMIAGAEHLCKPPTTTSDHDEMEEHRCSPRVRTAALNHFLVHPFFHVHVGMQVLILVE